MHDSEDVFPYPFTDAEHDPNTSTLEPRRDPPKIRIKKFQRKKLSLLEDPATETVPEDLSVWYE